MKKLMVLDGNSIVNRAFFGVRQNLSTRDGQPTNAVFGFLNILGKLVEDSGPDALCVTFDRKAPTFRHLAYEGYKATRKGMPEELAAQMPVLKEVLEAMSIPRYELDGWEADDLLGTIARLDAQAGWCTELVTGDRDALQLISPQTTVKLVTTRMGRTTTRDMTPEAFREEYGFDPIHIIDLKALMGDTSDNIPGVKGVGEKTAMALVRRYGSVEALYAALPQVEMEPGQPAKPGVVKKLEEGREQARMSYELATIRTDAPIDFTPEANLRRPPDNDRLYGLFTRLEFSRFIDRYHLTPPQGKQPQAREEAVEGTCQSECVMDWERAQELLALWRGLDCVNVLVLPGLDALCVEWSAGETEGRAAVCAEALLGTHWEDFLRVLFSAEISKCTHDEKPLQSALLSRALPADGFVFDTALAAYLLAPADGGYELEKLGLSYFGFQPSKGELYRAEGALAPLLCFAAARAEGEEPEQGGEAVSEPLGALLSHTALIGALRETLTRRLEELGMRELYEKVELPLCRVLSEMEVEGFLADREALSAFGQALSGRIDSLQEGIYTLAGQRFNINSTQQLGKLLFDELGLPPAKKTKTGYSTNAEVLEKLRGKHPIVEEILEYRQLTKLKSTYADGLGKVIGPDGRIHTCFQNTVTATGRLSSVEPNLQNIPVRTELGAQLRRMFVAGPGKVLVDADYSQIELRLLAHIAGDEAMIEGFRSGADIHTITAAQVFGTAPEAVTPLMRRSAKAVNFGIVYGISAFSLSQDLHISVSQARDYMNRYLEHYAGVRAYMAEIVERGRRDGYVTTLMGRRRWLPELNSASFNTRAFGERVALNAPIQGSAADIIKLAMIRVRERLLREGLEGRLVLQVHDELIVECPERESEAVTRLLREEMEGVMALSVPLVAETHAGKSWADAH